MSTTKKMIENFEESKKEDFHNGQGVLILAWYSCPCGLESDDMHWVVTEEGQHVSVSSKNIIGQLK